MAACESGPPTKAYPGKIRDLQELSVIKSRYQATKYVTYIYTFDDKPTQNHVEINALPGVHTLVVDVNAISKGVNYSTGKKITFTSEAGHTYWVQGQLKLVQLTPPKGEVHVWITEEGTNKIVAGTPAPGE